MLSTQDRMLNSLAKSARLGRDLVVFATTKTNFGSYSTCTAEHMPDFGVMREMIEKLIIAGREVAVVQIMNVHKASLNRILTFTHWQHNLNPHGISYSQEQKMQTYKVQKYLHQFKSNVPFFCISVTSCKLGCGNLRCLNCYTSFS